MLFCVAFQVAKDMQNQQPPYDEYRFFANVTCRPNYGGGYGSFVPKYDRSIVVSPLKI